jgi:hypothetical protein
VNVHGTRNTLEACLNAKVKCFVHGSTIGVYGSTLEGKIDEQSPLKPDNIYGVTKLEGEHVVHSFQDNTVVIIRISETYGPGDYRLLKLFRAIKKRLFFMIGDGTNLHHLIYIDDLIAGLILASSSPSAGERPSSRRCAASHHQRHGRNHRHPAWRQKVERPFAADAASRTCHHTGESLGPLGFSRHCIVGGWIFQKSFVFLWNGLRGASFTPHTAFQQGVAETPKWYSEMSYL